MDPKSPHYYDKIHIDILTNLIFEECSLNGESGLNWGTSSPYLITNIFHHRMDGGYLFIYDIFEILESKRTPKCPANANISLDRIKYKLKQRVGMIND